MLQREGSDLPILQGDNRLVAGKFSVSGFFKGDIDEVPVRNYAMTDAEVAEIYSQRVWAVVASYVTEERNEKGFLPLVTSTGATEVAELSPAEEPTVTNLQVVTALHEEDRAGSSPDGEALDQEPDSIALPGVAAPVAENEGAAHQSYLPLIVSRNNGG